MNLPGAQTTGRCLDPPSSHGCGGRETSHIAGCGNAIQKNKMTPHNPPCKQWLMRQDVGAGSIGIDPSWKHLTIPPASSGSWGWMWVLGVGVDPVVIGVVLFSLCGACCHITTHPICTPCAEGAHGSSGRWGGGDCSSIVWLCSILARQTLTSRSWQCSTNTCKHINENVNASKMHKQKHVTMQIHTNSPWYINGSHFCAFLWVCPTFYVCKVIQ